LIAAEAFLYLRSSDHSAQRCEQRESAAILRIFVQTAGRERSTANVAVDHHRQLLNVLDNMLTFIAATIR
jgi:hypothetical protein